MLSIGQRLAQARKARGLNHEDVAFYTRIPVARVRDLENDDLSRFANLTYARGFLKIYSRYLDIDISSYLDQFSTEEFAHAASREYVETASATRNLPQAVFTDYGRARRPGLYVLIALIAGLGAFLYWQGRNDPQETVADQKEPAANPKEISADQKEASPPPSAPAIAAPSAAEKPGVPAEVEAPAPAVAENSSKPPQPEPEQLLPPNASPPPVRDPHPGDGTVPKAIPVPDDEPEPGPQPN